MKRSFALSIAIALTIGVFAQSPQKMSYQAVIRNTAGGLVTNHAVGLRISILRGSATGTVVYSETYNPVPQTNANGLVTIEIGNGTPVTGTFSGIDWSAGSYYLKTEADPSGGTSYTVIGTSQILSVPYALYSRSSETIADNSVTSAKIVDGAVATVDLANSSVTSAKIADGTISASDLADNSITSSKIVDATITAADLASNAVTTDKINNAAVTGAKIAQGGAITGQVLKWNGTSWVPASDAEGAGLTLPWSGTASSPTHTFKVTNSGSGTAIFGESATGSGVFGMTDGSNTSGVFGLAHALSGVSYGVRGESDSPDGFSGYFLGIKFYISGNTGIGIDNPTTKLDVNGQVRIRGGSPGAGKVLTSDATGLASWQTSSAFTLPFTGSASTENYVLQVSNSGPGNGISGTSIAGTGISGSATSTTSANIGVAGQSNSSNGSGVWGNNIASTGNGIAVRGSVESSTGYSGYFERGRFYIGGNTGIGTNTPSALLHANGTGAGQGNVVFTGEYKNTGPGNPPVSGAGTRMMWYPDKAAFRAGYVEANQWDASNIGSFSGAIGYSTTASGRYSTAFGYSTIASGDYSTAIGYSATASGSLSMSVGYSTTASGSYSTARGDYSTASGNYSTAMGQFITAPSYFETVIGCYNNTYTPASSTAWNDADRLFVISNGTSHSSRSNAITVMKNGKTGIGTANPGYKLDVVGDRIRLIESGTNDWIALRTDGGTNDYLDLSWGGGSLVMQGATTDENIIMNPSMNKVGIRTWTPQYDLDVNGNIRAIGSVYYGGTTTTTGTAYNKPDYVFGEEYNLLKTEDVEIFLKEKSHLPWVKSVEQEKQENGGATDMTRMAFETLESVENLQLQIIRQQNLIIEQKTKIEALELRLLKLESSVKLQRNK